MSNSMDASGLYQDDDGLWLCDITLPLPDGRPGASIQMRAGGRAGMGAGTRHGRTGVASVVVASEGLELALAEAAWDCREWQWWRGHEPYTSYEDEFRPRLALATPGYRRQGDVVEVTSAYTADGVHTLQRWVFRPPTRDDMFSYDCCQTITNLGASDLVEYAQFFANYTETNRNRGQWYWAANGALNSFQALGGNHLDAYIVAPDSEFARQGCIPHAMRGGGRVRDTWYRPALVGQATPQGWRHIILMDPVYTAGLASGMGGMAMDYILYPADNVLRRGQTFAAWVRHYVIRWREAVAVERLAELWGEFERDITTTNTTD